MKYIVIAGNILFILWILLNGMNEGWDVDVSILQKVSYIGLVVLLVLNSYLILRHGWRRRAVVEQN